MAGLDLSALQGIDVHVHVESDGHGQLSLDDELLAYGDVDLLPERETLYLW